MKFLLSKDIVHMKKGESAICLDRLMYIKAEQDGTYYTVPLKDFKNILPADQEIIVNFLNEAFQDLKGIHTVTFDDFGNLTYITVPHLSTVEELTPDAPISHTFVNWYVGKSVFDFDTPIVKDTTIVASYTIKTYTVTFKDYDNSTIGKTQTIDHGADAVPPENPVREGYIFTGWDKEFTNITANTTITATYEEESAPEED